MAFLFLLGRVLYVLIFLHSALTQLLPGKSVEYARSAGVPLPQALVPLAGALAVAGGLMLALGIKPRLAAWMLLAFLVPVTLVMHRFWGLGDPQAARPQTIQFLKNLGLIGAALMFQWIDRWPLSLWP